MQGFSRLKEWNHHSHKNSAPSNEYLCKIKSLSKDTCWLLISRDRIGWKAKLKIRLMTIHVTAQPNKVNMNEIDYVRWNEWDGLWTEGNNNETWSMKKSSKIEFDKEVILIYWCYYW